MATLKDGRPTLFSALQEHQPLPYVVTKIASLSLQRCRDVQTRKLTSNAI